MKASGFLSLACAAALTAACGGDATDRSVLDREDLTGERQAVGTTGAADDGGLFRTSDQEFVRERMAAGHAEVQLGQLASQRGTSAQVKQFGERMVQDHTKAGEQLRQIASRQGITTAAAIDDDHRDLMNRLSKLTGAEFDREYMQAMVDSHEDAVDELESRVNEHVRAATGTAVQPEVSSAPGSSARTETGGRTVRMTPAGQAGADAAMSVEAWASQQLPIVRQHLEQARAIHEALDDRDSSVRR
jgi:predicted outer membrane protein